MKVLKSTLITLLLALLCLSCKESGSNNESDFNIVGYWKIDSIETYNETLLINTYNDQPVLKYEMTKDVVISCNSDNKTGNHYEIITNSGTLFYRVITDQKTIESEFIIVDDDHYIIKHIPEGSPSGEYEMWYNSRITDVDPDNFCDN